MNPLNADQTSPDHFQSTGKFHFNDAICKTTDENNNFRTKPLIQKPVQLHYRWPLYYLICMLLTTICLYSLYTENIDKGQVIITSKPHLIRLNKCLHI